MPRQNTIQTAWTKGEVSPLAAGRVDVNLYQQAGKTIENFYARPQGCLIHRSGTKYVRRTKLANGARLIPFSVSDDVSYMLEFGATAGTAITGISSNAGLFRVTTGTHGLTTGDRVQIYGVTNYPGINRTWTITKISATVFDLQSSVFAGSGTADGKWVLYPGGYIHFYKEKEPLFETTTTEVESFTVDDDGGLMRLTVPFPDLPGWGDLVAIAGLPANNGDITLTNGIGTLVRVTTTVPHTLRTGTKVRMHSTELASINNTVYAIDRISEYAFDLVGSVYAAPGAGNTAFFSSGLLLGDRLFISGATNYPELTEQFFIVKGVGGATEVEKFTLANLAYVTHGAPTGEEAETIPIEVVTAFTEDDLPDIRFCQSADVLYLFHPRFSTQKLVRLDTDGDRLDWLLATINFLDGPYLGVNSLAPNFDTTTPANGTVFRDVQFEISSYVHTADVTAAANFAGGAADQNKYLEYRVGDEWGLAKLTSASSGVATGTVDIIDNVLQFLDETTQLTKKKGAPSPVPGSEQNSQSIYRYGGYNTRTGQYIDTRNQVESERTIAQITAGAGILKSQFSNTFAQADVGKYVRVTTSDAVGVSVGPLAYWVQIVKIKDGTGAQANHSIALTMVSNNATGKFVLSNEVRTATLKAYRNNATFAAFTSTDVGRLVRLGFGGRWTWAKITAYVSTSQVTITLYEDMPRDPRNAANVAGALDGTLTYSAGGLVTGSTTGRTYDWRMGAWSETTGYPGCGTFHEQRLMLAATRVNPQTIWGSVSGDFENMLPSERDSTVLDDNAIVYTLGSAKANPIKWMVSGSALFVGTTGDEWQLRSSGSNANEPLTPANVQAKSYTGHGAHGRALPALIGSSVVFADRSSEKVMEIFYSYEADAVQSHDLTVISEHILREHSGAVAAAYQEKPTPVYWVVCGDGTLAAMTFVKEQEVTAWHHHTIAGGFVEDIAVIPASDGRSDEVWIVVKRTISGSDVRSVEVIESDYRPASMSSRLGMRFLDGHRLISNFAGTTITGLDNMEGVVLSVVRDGVADDATVTVNAGAVVIAGAANEVLLGQYSNADLESLPPEGGSGFGTSQGQIKKVISLDVRVFKTASLQVGATSASNLETHTFKVQTPNVWFTGTERTKPRIPYDPESSWFIRQNKPYPLTLLFAVAKVETNE